MTRIAKVRNYQQRQSNLARYVTQRNPGGRILSEVGYLFAPTTGVMQLSVNCVIGPCRIAIYCFLWPFKPCDSTDPKSCERLRG